MDSSIGANSSAINNHSAPEEQPTSNIPAITLPKGGGAIKGIDEKFAVNPATGAASMSVPIATSPGRSGFGPQLSLSYNSGAGNGTFGFGWSMSLPAITRKTDKGLPKYFDAEESDTFILSGAEDMVPVLDENNERFEDIHISPDYIIHRYRPRIEGLFARIERWTRKDNGDVHWRSISRDNILTVYGKNINSRIYNPNDSKQIFSWLICETYDDKGNGIIYIYKEEDSEEVDLSQAHERNRGDLDDSRRKVNRYIKHIRYGNHQTLLDDERKRPFTLSETQIENIDWLFEVVFDYGEHDLEVPRPNDIGTWACRPDPFSSYRAGFETRTYRLCQRVLMFHNFPELGSEPCLVRSTDFNYRYEEEFDDPSTPVFSFMLSVIQSGYKRQDDDGYIKRSHPPLEFEYTRPLTQEQLNEQPVESLGAESLQNLPVGLGNGYQWVDLDGEGISGILTEQGGAWYYKPNWGNGRFGPLETVSAKPSLAALGSGRQQLIDLAGDGQLDLAQFVEPIPGFYERTFDEKWVKFRTFKSLPVVDWSDPNLRFVDLTGDGHADILITEDHALVWHLSLAEAGFDQAERVTQALDEEQGPRLIFADGTQSIYLADFSGDGLVDLARIRNGQVCYWPNLGYGHFGAKVTMDNAPWFDVSNQFNQERIRLADIDGSGTMDIIYLGRDSIDIYCNQAGNSWGKPLQLTHFPPVDNLSAISAVDLLGNGTACLVWSSSLPGVNGYHMRYIDLMGGKKPHLLAKIVNNLGAETHVQYASSTKFYLQDKWEGKPWITRLPFPVHCVEKTTIKDNWRGTSFSTTYCYHHGYYDGIEREFRGFGRVEQLDAETYGEFERGNSASPYISDDKTLYQPPVKTITWFHTGVFLDRERILHHFQTEYFPHWLGEAGYAIDDAFAERALPEPDITRLDLNASEWREALRACKGMTLRQEVYELDVDALEEGQHVPTKLFTAADHNCQIHLIQPRANNKHAVFLITESEALTYHYELDLEEPTLRPDPRIAHTLVLSTNVYGQPLQQAAVGYPRVRQFTEETPTLKAETIDLIRAVQDELHIGYTETCYTNDVLSADQYRLRLPCEVSKFEVTGIRSQDEEDLATPDPWDDVYFTLEELRRFRLSERYQTEGIEVETIPYHHFPSHAQPQMRLVEQGRTLFFNENLVEELALGVLNHLGLPYETYKLALTNDLLDKILRKKLEDLVEAGETYDAAVQRVLEVGGYYSWDGQWWTRSGIAGFAPDASEHFYLPERYIDPFNQETKLTYDEYDIYIQQSEDPVGNMTFVDDFDFRVLAPAVIKDPNDNYSAVAFDILGLPAGIAIMGKEGTESGDSLDGLRTDLPIEELSAFLGKDDDDPSDDYDESVVREWLGQATARFVYYLGEKQVEDQISYGHHPACACGILRETHVNQTDAEASVQVAFEYSDGLGQLLVTKALAEPETPDGPLRWLASGKTILNNKGKPVKQYEPYFSPSGYRFEEPHEAGVSPVMYYDAVGRLVRTEQPNGVYSRVEFSPWFMAAYDANDTVLEPGNSWYARNSTSEAAEAQRAARLTADHADTPTVTHLDSLGREVIAITHNRWRDDTGTTDEKIVTFIKLDAEGKPLWIRDDRGNLVMQYIFPLKPIRRADDEPDPRHLEDVPADSTPCYDIAGNLLYQYSMDAGDRWMLNDVTGKPLYAWDSRNNILHTTYDPLHRPLTLKLRNDTHTDWIVVGCTRYGDERDQPETWVTEAKTCNLRGQAYRSYDQSGLVTQERFDFKGNALEVQRRLVLDFEGDVNWHGMQSLSLDEEPDALLMPETYHQIREYDALNRVTRQFNWHQGTGSRVAVVEPHYNQRGLLEGQDVVLDAIKTEGGYEGGARNTMMERQTYNEKGQRLSIEYGNETTTTYVYDEATFRLKHLQTVRHGDGKNLQDLHYTYDPVGNITEIKDLAHPTVFFNNSRIDNHNRYTYDALYRLIQAEGREHAGQVTYDNYDNWHDCAFRNRHPPNSEFAWRNYTERYKYDTVGNILMTRHIANDNNWTRQYQYAQNSNRLLATGMGGGDVAHYVDSPSLDYRYTYNDHGSMTSMPHLTSMAWDFTEHLHHIARSAGTQSEEEGGCPDASLEAWYRYDAARQRTYKRVIKNQGSIVEERLYLSRVEIFRRSKNGTLELERETFHVMDNQQRIALVETRTRGNDSSPEQLVRYQLGNHLGSACLEMDPGAQVISYEEYYPFGSTSYQAVRSNVEVSSKRYRYSGKERDEESGLNFHKARYYVTWLGRWASCDPSMLVDGINIFLYAKNNPINRIDRTGLCGDDPDAPCFSHGQLDLTRLWDTDNLCPDNPELPCVLNFDRELDEFTPIDSLGEELTPNEEPQIEGAFEIGVWNALADLVVHTLALFSGLTFGAYGTPDDNIAREAIERMREFARMDYPSAEAAELGQLTEHTFTILQLLLLGVTLGGIVIRGLSRIAPSLRTISPPRTGPGANIPNNARAFLERGMFFETTETTFLVRAGPAGRYGAHHLFTSRSEAEAFARQMSRLGRSEIRRQFALPLVWENGQAGNPVDFIRVFRVPRGTRGIQGVVGPQQEGLLLHLGARRFPGIPNNYPGGASQVAIDWTVSLEEVSAFAVTL